MTPIFPIKKKALILISLLYTGFLIYPTAFVFSKVSSTNNLQVNTEYTSNQVRTGGKSPRAIVKSQNSNNFKTGTQKKAFDHWKSLIQNKTNTKFNNQTSTSSTHLKNFEEMAKPKRRNVPGIKDLERLSNPTEKELLQKSKPPGVSDLKRLMKQPESVSPSNRE